MTAVEDKYWVWEFEPLAVYHQPPPKLANPDDFDRDEIEFKRGDRIEVEVPVARFVADPKQKLNDYLFNVPAWPLCSGKLRHALEQAGVQNVQYFPVDVVAKDGKTLGRDYNVANFLARVKCLDWESSVVDPTYRADGLAIHIDKLVLDTDAIQGRKVLRMEENSTVLLVAQSVRDLIESLGITGVRFTDPADFQV